MVTGPKDVSVNCERLGSQGRSEAFASSAGARTGRVLAFKESQEPPVFSTVGNDNKRTQSRLHGLAATERPRAIEARAVGSSPEWICSS